MRIDDPETVTLLVVGRCQHQATIGANRNDDDRAPEKPRCPAGRGGIKVRRRGHSMEPSDKSFPHSSQSRLMRMAAAAARGARLKVRNKRAASRYSGPDGSSPSPARSV